MKLKHTVEDRLVHELSKEIQNEVDKEIADTILKLAKGKLMTNVFKDQERFMVAGDQTVDHFNAKQYNMYLNLIKEEVGELHEAVDDNILTEQLDALIDILVVTVGAIHSMGADGEGAWNEVMSTNFAKINPETGKVNKREDGKILKPVDWQAPVLQPFLTKHHI